MIKALIICGFPGIGKTTAERVYREAIDCESSGFHYIFDPTEVNAENPFCMKKENPNWVSEYVDHILACAKDGIYQFVLASSHKEVREELDKRCAAYICVVPDRSLKDEYLSRYVKRGDCAEFIINVSESWDEWLDEIEANAPAIVHLKAGQVLADLLPIPQLRGGYEGEKLMELKSCPFCGAKANMWSWNGGTRIDCSNWCSTHYVGVEGKTVEEAIKAWNRRAEDGEWIPVTERLPEQQVPVLAVLSDSETLTEFCITQRDRKGYWSIDCDPYGIWKDEDFKCWMPLPEPPKEKS